MRYRFKNYSKKTNKSLMDYDKKELSHHTVFVYSLILPFQLNGIE
jgi:hypothetical protein